MNAERAWTGRRGGEEMHMGKDAFKIPDALKGFEIEQSPVGPPRYVRRDERFTTYAQMDAQTGKWDFLIEETVETRGMTKNDNLELSHLDVLAIIGFDAQRVVAAVQAAASGFMSAPRDLQAIIDHMSAMNAYLLALAVPSFAEMQAQSHMGAEFTVEKGKMEVELT
jgi:hypothetical protein